MSVLAELQVFDKHGAFIDVLPRRRDLTWTDELNGPGGGSVSVSLDDAKMTPALLDYHNIIKILIDGTKRSAFRVEQRSPVVAAAGEYGDRWVQVTGRGVLSLLEAGVVFPEGGLLSTSGDNRAFNYAAATGAWYNASDWTAPLGVAYTASTVRGQSTQGWPDPAAQWIWPTNPDSTVAQGATAMFRGSFSVATATSARVFATGDNQFELWLDGELILSSDPAQQWTWQQTNTYDIALSAGTHRLAAKVVNGPAMGGPNPAAFIATVMSVNSAGQPQVVLFRTDTTHWLSTQNNVGWRAAQILKTLVSEAQSRAASGVALALPTLGFTDTTDTAGNSWSDVQDVELPIAQAILEAIPQLCETGPIDVAMTPDLVLNAWKQRGTDRSTGANLIRLLPGQNLLEHSISGQANIRNSLLVRSGAGWVQRTDLTSQSTYGTWEGGLQLGSTNSTTQSSAVGDAGLGIVANPQVTYTSKARLAAGATPYVDFDVGDKVQTVDETGTAVGVTVAALIFAEDNDSGQLTYVPQFRP